MCQAAHMRVRLHMCAFSRVCLMKHSTHVVDKHMHHLTRYARPTQHMRSVLIEEMTINKRTQGHATMEPLPEATDAVHSSCDLPNSMQLIAAEMARPKESQESVP